MNIPAGVDSGMKVRLPGQGDAPMAGGGPNGDLFVTLIVQPSSQFKRDGNDVLYDVSIPLTTAILGGNVRVPTVDGEVDLKIPPGSQPDDRKVLRKRGIPLVGRSENERGDHWVTLKVAIPKKLTDKQRDLIEQFAKESDKSDK